MILRFARRIAEGKLKKDDIIIYEFKLTENGSRVKKVTFDENGNLKKWPAQFFETDLEETMKHIKAQVRRGGATVSQWDFTESFSQSISMTNSWHMRDVF
jgi:predicted ATPase